MALYDIIGAFLQLKILCLKNIKGKDSKVLIKISSEIFVNIMCEVNPRYKDYIVCEKL